MSSKSRKTAKAEAKAETKAEAPAESGRVTLETLESRVEELNSLTGAPSQPFADDGNGNMVPQPGAHYLVNERGGVQVRRVGEGGTLSDALGSGFVPKRILEGYIAAFIQGWNAKG